VHPNNLDLLHVGRERIEAELQVVRSVASSKMGAKQGAFIYRSILGTFMLGVTGGEILALILNARSLKVFSSFFI
jgi:hypothetical protein